MNSSKQAIAAFDVGNTDIVGGLFIGEQLVAEIRLPSARASLAGLREFLDSKIKEHGVSSAIVGILCSVVPALNEGLLAVLGGVCADEPLIVSSALNSGLSVQVDYPERLGADRLANAAAARQLYGAPVIVVDFGTATTVDVVDAQGAFIGGVIAPGLNIAAEALFSRTALLPRLNVQRPDKAIGRNTEDAMYSGIYFGYAGLVEGLLKRVCSELGCRPPVVATGGLAPLIAGEVPDISRVEPGLTLRGLQLLALWNAPPQERASKE